MKERIIKMLQLRTNSARYGVEFEHSVVEDGFSPVKRKVKVSASTVCRFYKRGSDNRWELLSEGTSKFNDDKDTFSFYQGRKHALAFAVKQLPLPKKTKAEIWESFLKIVGYPTDPVYIPEEVA